MHRLKGILACATVMAFALFGINAMMYQHTVGGFGSAFVLYFIIGAVVGLVVSLVGHTRPVVTAVITMVALWAVFVWVMVDEFGHSGVDTVRLITDTLTLAGVAALSGFGYKLAAREKNPSEGDNA